MTETVAVSVALAEAVLAVVPEAVLAVVPEADSAEAVLMVAVPAAVGNTLLDYWWAPLFVIQCARFLFNEYKEHYGNVR